MVSIHGSHRLVWIPAGQDMEASNLRCFFTNHLLSLPPAPDCSCSNSGLLCLLVASFTCRRHYTHTHANAMFPMDCNHNDAKTQHAPYANRCPLFSVHRKQTGRQRPSSQPVANNPQLMMSPSNQSLSNDLPYLVKVEFGGYGTAKANLIPIVNTNLIFALGVMSQ